MNCNKKATNGRKGVMKGKKERGYRQKKIEYLQKLQKKATFTLRMNRHDRKTIQMKRTTLSTPYIIHLFAAAHALIAAMSRLVNYVDDVPLTVLTIALIVIIALRHRLHAEMVATLTLIGTFAGYLIGSYGATLIALIVPNPILASALATALYTELLGWSIYAVARLRGDAHGGRVGWSPPVAQLILIVSMILLFRISYTLIFNSDYFVHTSVYSEAHRLFKNTFALLMMLCGNLFFATFRTRLIARRELRMLVTALLIAIFSAVIALTVYYNFPNGNTAIFVMLPFFRLYAVVLLCDIVVYALMMLIAYVMTSQSELSSERGKKHLAQFQYNKLKMQINPHFLFNSLNILDYLVQEQQSERASAFIRKLADCYRYMLKTEDEQLVHLSEEVVFARKYIDLLQERFTDGFSVQFELSADALRHYVVPCSLQLLIENATKHNIVSSEQPLVVTIRDEADTLIVTNNLQPRISRQASTGKGLKNIRQQYLDLSDRTILVEQTETHFTVQLPLL